MSSHDAVSLFIHVEEPSMATALGVLIPRIIDNRQCALKIIDHGSKQALLGHLPARLQGYARWRNPALRVLVLVDRDDDDCHRLKARLEEASAAAGLYSKTRPGPGGRFRIVNRIVVEELESWFFGDVAALAAAYPGFPTSLPKREAFRDPDAIRGGTWEALLRVLKKSGHYAASSRLPKIEVARRVAEHMDPGRNRSASFHAFTTGLNALIA